MSEQLEVRVQGETAEEAIAAAKAWAKAEPNLRLRTVAKVRRSEVGPAWIVTLAVSWR